MSKYITFFCIDGLLHPHLLVDLHPVARQAGNGSRYNSYKNISHGKARPNKERDKVLDSNILGSDTRIWYQELDPDLNPTMD